MPYRQYRRKDYFRSWAIYTFSDLLQYDIFKTLEKSDSLHWLLEKPILTSSGEDITNYFNKFYYQNLVQLKVKTASTELLVNYKNYMSSVYYGFPLFRKNGQFSAWKFNCHSQEKFIM